MKKLSTLLFSILMGLAAIAQTIPSPKDFLGYEPGAKFTPHYKLVQYYEALAKAAPALMKLEQYGVTNGGRPLLVAFLSTAENISNLEAIRTNNLKLAGALPGGGTSNGTAIVWLSYNVHGNEASSSEASMKTIYTLLTDAKSREWLKNTVVIIDPCLNPDGRDRYVNWFNGLVGQNSNSDPQSREHSEPWPGGRSNYYNFDLNRDWAWQTQVETQARIKKYQEWMPQVHVDYHEQGYNQPYYFAPAAEPFHEAVTPWQRDFQTQIGRNNARYFDQSGWLYFTKERFDLFYPSYGDTWPTFNGSVGMTYEQGGHSRGGLAVLTNTGDTLTLTDRVMHHYTTGLATVEISSANAASLQKNFKEFFDNNSAKGVGPYQSFVVKAKDAGSKLAGIKKLLENNRIQYGYSNGGSAKGFNYFTAKEENITLDKGDLIVHTAQPEGVMAKVLFEPLSKLSDSVTYDITAWAIPYVYGVQAYAVKEKIAAATIAPATPPAVAVGNAYGYIKSWTGLPDAQFLAGCISKGIKVRISEKPFEVGGRQYAAGSLILIKTSNSAVASFDATVQAIAAENGVVLDAVQSGFMDKGADFGSPDVKIINRPKVAMLTGETVSSLGAGEVWHFFEKQLKYPITLINANEAGRVDWRKYNVLIVPDGRYRTLFAKDGDLKSWVQQGGKLIVLENAVSQLASAEWGLNARKDDEDDDKSKSKKDDYSLLKKYANAERDMMAKSNPGSIFRVALDNTHPLAFGYPDFYYTLKGDENIYDFMKEGWNVGIIKKGSQVSGFTGTKAKAKLQDGVLFGELPVGNGSVVFFADDVLFRSFWENGKLMFANAVFLVNQGNGYDL